MLFNVYQTRCTWKEKYNEAIIKSFNHRCSHRLSDVLGDGRRENEKPQFVVPEVWDQLRVKWADEKYKAVCAQAKENRASEAGGSLHTGGSVSAGTHRDRLVC